MATATQPTAELACLPDAGVSVGDGFPCTVSDRHDRDTFADSHRRDHRMRVAVQAVSGLPAGADR